MRIFQGLGSLSEVLSKAKKLLLRERRETFRVRMSASAFRAAARDHGHEGDEFDEEMIVHIVEEARNSSHLTQDREKFETNSEPKKKET
jgi:hypothetical protein